jgi:protein tyrosine phosphatase
MIRIFLQNLLSVESINESTKAFAQDIIFKVVHKMVEGTKERNEYVPFERSDNIIAREVEKIRKKRIHFVAYLRVATLKIF